MGDGVVEGVCDSGDDRDEKFRVRLIPFSTVRSGPAERGCRAGGDRGRNGTEPTSSPSTLGKVFLFLFVALSRSTSSAHSRR